MIKKCIGCGVKLQTENKKEKGYVPIESFHKGYCMRCFRLTHYHELQNAYHDINPNDILKKLEKKKGVCFFLCDFMNLNDEAFSYYHQIQLPKFFVISKADIIPKSISYDKLKKWLKKEGNVKEEIFFVSQKYSEGLRRLQKKLEEIELPVYFMGMTNTGKSNLLNTLFHLEKKLTVSELPNTTVDFIKLPLTDRIIYDTAGFPYDAPLNFSYIKDINVTKRINPIIMPLKKDASLVIKDFIRLEVSKQNRITCFFAPKLKPQKMYPNQLIYLEEKPLIYDIPEETNVILKGIGIFYIKNACKIKIYHVSKELISILPSFMKKK